MEFSKEIFREIYKKSGTTPNIKELARDIDVPYTTLWYQIRTKRRWHVEDWLLTLNRLGAVKIEGNKIVIDSEAVKKLKGVFL